MGLLDGQAYVKFGSYYNKILDMYAKENGAQKKVTDVYVKENGVWKTSWKNNFKPPSYASLPATIVRGAIVTWNCEDISGASYELQYRYNGGAWSSSLFFANNSGQLQASSSVSYTSWQIRVRAVNPNTHDKQSLWVDSPTRSLTPQTLANPTGLSYPSSITRNTKISVSWNEVSSAITYTVDAIYTRSDGSTSPAHPFNGHGSSFAYNVASYTSFDKLQFRIKASQSGYYSSGWVYGPTINLTPEKLGRPKSMYAPDAYDGQRITVSWSAVPNAERYRVQYQCDFTPGVDSDTAPWTTQYTGASRSFSYTIKGAPGRDFQFRVQAIATNYEDGDFTYSPEHNINKPPLKTTTWKATKTLSWRDRYGGWRDDNDYVYQGSWNDGTYWGNHRGLAFFDYNSIKHTLSDRTIEKVQIYFYRINSGGYYSNVPINLYTHTYASVPSGEPTDMTHVKGPFGSWDRGQGQWITVPNSVAQRIADGTAKGIGLYMSNGTDYLYMSHNVQIKVEYR